MSVCLSVHPSTVTFLTRFWWLFALYFGTQTVRFVRGQNLITPSPIFRPPIRSNGRSSVLPMMFLFFQRQISELPRPIAVRLCHTIGIWFYFIMQIQKFGGCSPKKIGGQNHAKFQWILYNLTLWSRISPEWLKTSKIGKVIDREQFLPRSNKKVRWTLVHKWQRSICEFEPTKMHFSLGHYISAHRGCCDLKLLHALEIDQALLAHTQTGTGVPQKIVIVKI